MIDPDHLVWVCSDCGHEYGVEKYKSPTLYTGFPCSWCGDEETVVVRPEVYGLPHRSKKDKQND